MSSLSSCQCSFRLDHPGHLAASLLARCFISKPRMDKLAGIVFRNCPVELRSIYNNAIDDKIGESWYDTLPGKTFVYTGGHESFRSSISLFVYRAKRAECEIVLNIAKSEAHTWRTFEAFSHQKALLALAPNMNISHLMTGYRRFAEDIYKVHVALERVP